MVFRIVLLTPATVSSPMYIYAISNSCLNELYTFQARTVPGTSVSSPTCYRDQCVQLVQVTKSGNVNISPVEQQKKAGKAALKV